VQGLAKRWIAVLCMAAGIVVLLIAAHAVLAGTPPAPPTPIATPMPTCGHAGGCDNKTTYSTLDTCEGCCDGHCSGSQNSQCHLWCSENHEPG
jgi:hypothetical protein